MQAHVLTPQTAPVREPPGLVALVARLSTARTMDSLMAIVTQGVRNLLCADGATFVLRDHDRCYYAEEDAISPLWKGQRFPLRNCISGWCMLNSKAAIVPDIEKDPRIPQDAYRPTFVRSLVMAPVRREMPIAALGAYWSEVREIRPQDVELLQAIADSAALAVAYVQLQRTATPGRAPPAQADSRPPAAHTRAWRAPAQAYGAAATLVAGVTLMRLAVGALGVDGFSPFVAYFPAVLLAALAGGPRPALLAAVLGAALADLTLLTPPYLASSIQPAHLANVALFLASSGFAVWILERYRRAFLRMAEEDAHRTGIARELQHRTRNAIAVTQAIVSQSLRSNPTQARTINDRIRAGVAEVDLGDAAVTHPISLGELLSAELEPFGLANFEVAGQEDAPIPPRQRSTLALTLHELATNAMKYGALSVPEGRVRVAWRLQGGQRRITWTESGGPAVQPPQRRGYGSVFLRRLIEGGGGSIVTDFRESGVVVEIALPLIPPGRRAA